MELFTPPSAGQLVDPQPSDERIARVVITDDSAVARRLLRGILSGDRSNVNGALVRFHLNSLNRDEFHDGIAFVATPAGSLVARPGTPIAALTRPSNDPAVATALTGGSTFAEARSAGAKVLSVTVPVEGIGWTLTATVPQPVALAEIGGVRRGVEWITAVLAAVLIGT